MPKIILVASESVTVKLENKSMLKIRPGTEILVTEKEAKDLLATGAFEMSPLPVQPKQEIKKAEAAPVKKNNNTKGRK